MGRSAFSCSTTSRRCRRRQRWSWMRAVISCGIEAAVVSLVSRPVLFALARALGEAWPGDVPRDTLVARAFGAKAADESHRVRLRVEIARLRAMLRQLAGVSATRRGFALVPRHAREVVVLAQPVDLEHGAVLALLADGEVLVELGAGHRPRHQPADRAAGARRVGDCRQGAAFRPRARPALDDPACAGIPDGFVTPGAAAERLASRHETSSRRNRPRVWSVSGNGRSCRRHL